MVYSIEDPKGKTLYVHGKGKYFYLSREKDGALENMPEGWKIIKIKGKLYLKREA